MVVSVEACKPPARSPRGDAFEVLQPGISLGNWLGGCGTLGMFVVDAADRLCILSAHHVLVGKSGMVVQPAAGDGGTHEDAVARVWTYVKRLDAALALVNSDAVCEIAPLGTDALITGFRKWRPGGQLEMSARSSGVVRAIVREAYAGPPTNSFTLEPIEGALPAAGDSGGVWYDPATGLGVGLHHGLTPSGKYAVAVDLTEIARKLVIEPWNGTTLD